MVRPSSHSEINAIIAANLRRIRQEKGVSQQALAARMGCSCQQQHKREFGLNRISAGQLKQMSETLGVPVGAFFAGLPETEKAPDVLDDFMALAQLLSDADLEMLLAITRLMAEREAGDATA